MGYTFFSLVFFLCSHKAGAEQREWEVGRLKQKERMQQRPTLLDIHDREILIG